MRRFGLIGYPLSHSFSPGYFAEKFKKEGIKDCDYQSYPLATIDELEKLIEDDLVGINVTIPYKEQVIPYMTEVSEAVQAIGAVNTIINRKGKLYGYNSDVVGFQLSLEKWIGIENLPEKALILGSGGAAKAVAYVCQNLKINHQVVSRKSGFLNYEDVSESVLHDHSLIVNTTPLGMSPKIDQCPPLVYEHLTEKHYCYDLIYNPEKTLFLKNAEDQGAAIKNGYEMLILQAEESWRIWNEGNEENVEC